MTTLIEAHSLTGDNPLVELVENGNLIVLQGVALVSHGSGNAAVVAGFDNHNIDNFGWIEGEVGIELGDSESFGGVIDNGVTGHIAGRDYAIQVFGVDGHINNHGIIRSTQTAIAFLTDGHLGDGGEASQRVVNTGTIVGGDDAVYASGATPVILTNSGIMSAGNWVFFGSTNGDSVINSGTMNGNVNTGLDEDFLRNDGRINGFVETGFGEDEVLNFGIIAGNVETLWDDDVIENGGTIQGLVALLDGHDQLVNSGQIGRSVFGGDGSDYVENRGTIAGNLSFGDGDDEYEGLGGMVNGQVRMGDGDDSAEVSALSERVFGGLGADIIDFANVSTVYFDMRTGLARAFDGTVDLIRGFEIVMGSEGDDTVLGNRQDNSVDGEEGDDSLVGNLGNDTLAGDEGEDLLFGGMGDDELSGIEDDDTLDGGAGNDLMLGGEGDDDVVGDEGNDTILGGLGEDWLRGATGADDYVFFSAAEFGDRIVGFNWQLNGGDRLMLESSIFSGQIDVGVIDAELFHRGATNAAAEADDRFILRSGDNTLWYDADGTGATAAIFMADFGTLSNVRHTAIEIFIPG